MHPTAVAIYAVIADSCNSVNNMMLIYRDSAFATRYCLQCISFEHGIYSQPARTILVYSELALQTHSLEPDIFAAFVSYGISFPIAPSTNSSTVSLLMTTAGVIKKDGKHLAEWLEGDPEMKICNPRLMTRMRNNSQLADKSFLCRSCRRRSYLSSLS